MKLPVTYRPTGNGLEDEFMELVAELINMAYEDGRAAWTDIRKTRHELREFAEYLGHPVESDSQRHL